MSISVLLADDHQIVRMGIRAVLAQAPDLEVVAEAGNGRDAVRLALELVPDVVVMDIGMPGLNGVEAVRLLKRGNAAIRVVALSVHTDLAFVGRMLRAGANGYVVKQTAPDELLAALRAAVAGRTYLSPMVAGALVSEWTERTGQDASDVSPLLSTREIEVLQLVAEGDSTKEIAVKLDLSAKTADSHRQHVMNKLGLRSVAELTKYAVRHGLTSLDS